MSSTSYAYTVLAVNGQGLVGPLAGPVTATTLDVTPPSARRARNTSR
ncbi:MAG: hypothetical protein IPI38_19730 [Gemmatimonadetes bacterium]|nr:hypothetical protein [Gemmatimonadota bacterium]